MTIIIATWKVSIPPPLQSPPTHLFFLSFVGEELGLPYKTVHGQKVCLHFLVSTLNILCEGGKSSAMTKLNVNFKIIYSVKDGM